MLAFFLLVTFFGIVGMGYEAMIPAYTRRIVQSGVEGYSMLLACSGVGATLGRRRRRLAGQQRRKERWAVGGMVIFAVFLAGAAFLPIWAGSLGRSRSGSGCGGLPAGAGFGAVVFYASAMTVIQLDLPDHLRGRIMGIWMIVYSGSVPLGALWTGRAAVAGALTSSWRSRPLLCVVVGVLVLAPGS